MQSRLLLCAGGPGAEAANPPPWRAAPVCALAGNLILAAWFNGPASRRSLMGPPDPLPWGHPPVLATLSPVSRRRPRRRHELGRQNDGGAPSADSSASWRRLSRIDEDDLDGRTYLPACLLVYAVTIERGNVVPDIVGRQDRTQPGRCATVVAFSCAESSASTAVPDELG